jgi:3-hydroxybutyryl-CoA dehydrogenase
MAARDALGLEAIRMVEGASRRPRTSTRRFVLRHASLLKTTTSSARRLPRHAEYSTVPRRAVHAPELLRKMVAEGRLGQKSGRGFYDWSKPA